MCGINGILSKYQWSFQVKSNIDRMNNAIRHRGPDDNGTFISDNIALGHVRLAIIDLSERGHQPMMSDDNRYVIVYNGEIYNFKEIKNQLKDYPFRSNTDTEVILAAYLYWGKDCLHHFNGMFAFAIYDTVEKTTFIARDRLGIKPLYYYQNENYFIFSSEIKGILASGLIPKKINRNVLPEYLQYQTVFAPNTILQDVQMLLPGHWMSIDQNHQIENHRYWNFNIENIEIQDNKTEIENRIRELFISSLDYRLIADVPFGAFLSGGIDSSLITAVIKKDLNKTIDTFSIIFKEKEFSEERYSNLIAEKYQTNHHPILLDVKEFLHDLPNALKAMDHPSGDGPNTYTVSKVTKQQGITMALSGLGGDELFGGYSIFKQSIDIQKCNFLNVLPINIRKTIGKVLYQLKPSPATQKIKNILQLPFIDYKNIYPEYRKALSDSYVQRLTGNYETSLKSIIQPFMENKNLPVLSKISLCEINTYMQNILLRDSDQMSMAHALEIRVLFLDHRLVEYVLKVSDSVKYPSSPKKLLLDAFKGYLPDELVYRKKMGFVFPWEKWLKNELKTEMDKHINELENREIFNPGAVSELWNKFQNNHPLITWTRVWPLIVLENWIKNNQIEE